MRVFKAILVLADISGYTRFVVLNRSSIIHAEQIVTELMEVVTDSASHPLRIEKLEGDAAFLFAEVEGDEATAVNDVCRQVKLFIELFQAKQHELFERSVGGCMCSACRAIETLSLKCVVHIGDVLEKEVAGKTELAGEPVILAHRLLKNSVEHKSYVLLTDVIVRHLDAPPYENCQEAEEDIAEIGRVSYSVYSSEAPKMDRAGKRPLTRVAGVSEAARLFLRSFSRRVGATSPKFRNIPE